MTIVIENESYEIFIAGLYVQSLHIMAATECFMRLIQR